MLRYEASAQERKKADPSFVRMTENNSHTTLLLSLATLLYTSHLETVIYPRRAHHRDDDILDRDDWRARTSREYYICVIYLST